MFLVISYIGVMLCSMGAVMTYIGFQKRGSISGLTLRERLRKSREPFLVIGGVMMLIGTLLIGQVTRY